jgi:RNA binding exosome subunit
MGVHHISWHSTASGLEDELVVADALAWLVGDQEAVSIEGTTSFHGPSVHLVTAVLERKGPATHSLSRLGAEVLSQIENELDSRMDEENVIHIRLDLLDLLAGKVSLTTPGERPTLKGRTKLQVYPGDDPNEIAIETLTKAREDSERLGLPETAKEE